MGSDVLVHVQDLPLVTHVLVQIQQFVLLLAVTELMTQLLLLCIQSFAMIPTWLIAMDALQPARLSQDGTVLDFPQFAQPYVGMES